MSHACDMRTWRIRRIIMGLFGFGKKKNNKDAVKEQMQLKQEISTDKGKELTIEQASPIVKSMIEQLNYPYRILSNQLSLEEVIMEYEVAFERGKQEGFIPVLVPEDDTLDEFFGILKDEDNYSVEEVLKKVSDNGKEILNKRFEEYTEPYDDETFDMEGFIGEVANGGPITEFSSLSNYDDGSMKETILFEVPTKNPWEVVAYVPFGGWNDCPDVEDMTAICKYWYQKYGAVPVIITHDTLEFLLPSQVVEREVIEVAKEHFAFCNDRVDQCTATGTLGEVADCIRQSPIWYFWWD